MPTWIKRIFNMIIEYTSDISNLITNKADLVDGKVPAEQLPSYVDDVIEFNNLQAPDTQISIIVGNNSYKNQIRFINGSSTSSNRIGSEDKYPNMFVNFGENTSEDDWTTFEPEKGKIYINTTNNHSYRWSGNYLIDLDSNWSQGIKDLQENTIRTDISQDFSNAQQDVALSNIGLQWIHVPYSLLGTTLDDATYTKLTNAYGIILTDVPSDYFGPREFICGSNNSDGTKVFAGLNLANTSAYIVLRTNHNLTSVRYTRTYDGAVPYDASKTLTSDQQDVALSNIGLNFVHVDYSLLGTTLTDEMFAVLDNAKGIILVNLPSNYYNPFVFIKGNNTSTSCIFVGFATGTTYCQIRLDKSTKILSNINANLTYVGTVRYIEKQDLTDTQKQQARTNIGAASFDDVFNDYVANGGTKTTKAAMYIELAAQLTENTYVIDNSKIGTVLTDADDAAIKKATSIVITNYNGRTIKLLSGNNDSKYIRFANTINVANGGAICLLLAYNISTKTFITNIRNISSYEYYKYNSTIDISVDEFNKINSFLYDNVFIIDKALINTTISNETVIAGLKRATMVIVKPTNNTETPVIYIVGNTHVDSNNIREFFNISNANETEIIIDRLTLIFSTNKLTMERFMHKTPYNIYKNAGGTKYTTEADFNAQLVKVMDMTVVE